MALTLRKLSQPELKKKFQKIQNALSCGTASGTIYKLIEQYEPQQKHIEQLNKTIHDLQQRLETSEERNRALDILGAAIEKGRKRK